MLSRILSYGVSIVLDVVWVVPVAVAASGAVIAISRRQDADRESIVDRLVTVWLVAALAAVALLTLLPRAGGSAPPRPSHFNPFRLVDTRDAVSNVALFLAVGFFGGLRWRSQPRPVVWVAVFSFCISAGIELVQWVVPIDRAASSHDVLFNTVGGLLGAVVAMIVVGLARRFGWHVLGQPVDS